MDCDNNVRRDGENLRLIVKDVPDAVSQLDAYQHTRKNLRYVAYAASAGLALVLAGYFGTRGTDGFRDSQTHVLTPMAMIALSGAAFGVGSFIYGFAIYQVNESRLNNVVRSYNQARPDSPIELEFKTGIKF